MDIYYHILFLSKDLDVCKKIRSLSKTSLYACNQYHKCLLNKQIFLQFGGFTWSISDIISDLILQNIIKSQHDNIYDSQTLCTGDYYIEPTAIKLTVKRLYNTLEKQYTF